MEGKGREEEWKGKKSMVLSFTNLSVSSRERAKEVVKDES